MPKPTPSESDRTDKQALKSLDERLNAFEAQRAPSGPTLGDSRAASDGYPQLAGMIGGVLGGLGLGWTFDHFAHTSPIGVVSGLLIGSVVSIVGSVVSAMRISDRAAARSGPVPPAPDRGDEDDE